MVILREWPRWLLAWPSWVCKAVFKPADLPGTCLVDHYCFWGDVSVQHLCTAMQESEALGDLKKPIFDLDVEHLVRAQLLRKRTWKLVLTSKNICQAGKDRLSGKCKTVPALLKRVLHCQDSWMPQSCKLAHTSLHHLPYQLSVTFLKPEKKFKLLSQPDLLLVQPVKQGTFKNKHGSSLFGWFFHSTVHLETDLGQYWRKFHLPQKSRSCACDVGSYLKIPETCQMWNFSPGYLIISPGDRISRQDTWYDISCAINRVCDSTAGVACEVILELAQHVHGDADVILGDGLMGVPAKCFQLICSTITANWSPERICSVMCGLWAEQQFHDSRLCVVPQLSAALLHSLPLRQQVSKRGPSVYKARVQ